MIRCFDERRRIISEGKVKTNGIEIWYEDFGDPSNPTVLMVIGAQYQCTWWSINLIKSIEEAGYHVVRFDNRDMGYSSWIEDFETNPYTLNDMATDAIGLMDALNIDRAHVIGRSMGGMIAQLMAINYPDRVISLISWMSSYWNEDPDVPAMTEEFLTWARKNMKSPPTNENDNTEYQLNLQRMIHGSRFPFNEDEMRISLKDHFNRAYNPKNHHSIAITSAPSRLDGLRKLNIPTLIIHGDEDPLVNYCHGVICAKVIPAAKLYTLKGIGHNLPEGIIPETVQNILKHIGSVK